MLSRRIGADLYESQLELGSKFFIEGNCEQSILAFTDAIENDENQPKTYMGVAETYLRRDGSNGLKKANDVLKQAYSEIRSQSITKCVSLHYIRFDPTKKDG